MKSSPTRLLVLVLTLSFTLPLAACDNPLTQVLGFGNVGPEDVKAEGEGEGIGDDDDDDDDDVPPPPPEPTMESATRDTVVWKRQRAVENDLMRALSLSKAELCREVETFSCIDEAHTAILGGQEPFELAQYVPVPAPTVTTPFALDRVVLSACSKRAELDATAAAGSRVVFTTFDLAGASVDGASLDAQAQVLYRRLLSRDPLPEELEALRPLIDGTSALDVAKLSCFAIGTSVEFAFN